jgi:hypothetical protein
MEALGPIQAVQRLMGREPTVENMDIWGPVGGLSPFHIAILADEQGGEGSTPSEVVSYNFINVSSREHFATLVYPQQHMATLN